MPFLYSWIMPWWYLKVMPSFWLPSGDKTWYGFLVTSGCLRFRNVWRAVRIGNFCPKLGFFIDQNGRKGRPNKNRFWLFSNRKMNVTVRAEKVDGKNRVICLVSMFSSWVMVLKLCKKVYFFPNFVRTSAKNLSLWNEFTYTRFFYKKRLRFS